MNLGGISASLFESEMFGHVRGAFTDARQDRKGRFELAHGGTIFLDEIGDLDPASQVKMLRVLQDRSFEVLGSSQRRTVDVRVVAATNRNLAEMVGARRVPRGPALPDQPDRRAPAAAPRTARRHPGARQPVRAGHGPGLPARGPAHRVGRDGVAEGPALARQHPPAQAVGRAHRARHRARRARGRRLPDDRRDGAAGTAARHAAAGRQHDDGRDREGDDRQVAAAPRAATSARSPRRWA